MNDFISKDNEAADLKFYMDESSTPYEEDENPLERTKEDEEFIYPDVKRVAVHTYPTLEIDLSSIFEYSVS